MNKDSQKRKIMRFLRGRTKKHVDSFCIYQWVERCHFHGWWELGIKLASSIPPNSLDEHYHKRFEFLLVDCRNKYKEQYIELRNPEAKTFFSVPKSFWSVCENLGITLHGDSERRLKLKFPDDKLLYIGKIRPDNCIFLFPAFSSNELKQWLNNRGFDFLRKDIRPRSSERYHHARLRIDWENAIELIQSYAITHQEKIHIIKQTNHKNEKRYFLRELFWKGLLQEAKKRAVLHANIQPSRYGWIGKGAGKRGVSYIYVVHKHETFIELYIDRGKEKYNENKAIFDELRESKGAIESVFGDQLEWEKLKEKRACRIRKKLLMGGYLDQNKWNEIYDTAIDTMCRFETALKPYIMKL